MTCYGAAMVGGAIAARSDRRFRGARWWQAIVDSRAEPSLVKWRPTSFVLSLAPLPHLLHSPSPLRFPSLCSSILWDFHFSRERQLCRSPLYVILLLMHFFAQSCVRYVNVRARDDGYSANCSKCDVTWCWRCVCGATMPQF